MDLIETLKNTYPEVWWSRAQQILRENDYMATENHYIGGNGAWSVKRKHKDYLAEVLDTITAPKDSRAAIVGGQPGAGKSHMLPAMYNPKQYFVIDPDDIKDWLIEKGLAPEVNSLTPRETGPLLHQESIVIAKKLTEKLLQENYNVIWPMTFTSPDAVRTRSKMARSRGYKVTGAFVLVSHETSTRRVKDRYNRGMQDFIEGKGLGGRFIDLDNIMRVQGTDVFTSLSTCFDTARVIKNDVDLV